MVSYKLFKYITAHTGGLSKNRRDDGTGRSIPPAAGGHIVALMTRRGGQWVDGTTAWQVTTGQVTCGTVVGKANTFLEMIHDQHSWRFSEKSNRTNE